MEIRLDPLTKTFGDQRAVDDVSFSAGIGVTGFLGPNGAGKSTTMRMVTGFLEPTAGAAYVDGQPVWPTTPELRRLIGYLPEHNPLYTDQYVREYLQYTARLQGVERPKARVDEIVERVGLTQEVGKTIGQLSKGFRQRVGLAQALVHDPPVLILDEPTSGFDPNQLADIRTLIGELGRTKVVLLSTHIMQEVQALCQRVLIINRGQLVADDPVERLGGRLAGGSVITLRCERTPSPERLQKMAGVRWVKIGGQEARVGVEPDREMRPALAAVAVEAGWGLLELRTEGGNLEDVFQAITRQSGSAA